MTYPEHEKLDAVKDRSQVIGEFLDHMGELGWHLAEYVTFKGYDEDQLVPVRQSIIQVLAKYFNVDLDRLEDEKRAMLESLRSAP